MVLYGRFWVAQESRSGIAYSSRRSRPDIDKFIEQNFAQCSEAPFLNLYFLSFFYFSFFSSFIYELHCKKGKPIQKNEKHGKKTQQQQQKTNGQEGEELLGPQSRWRAIPRPQRSHLHPGRGYSTPKPFLNNPYMCDSNTAPLTTRPPPLLLVHREK